MPPAKQLWTSTFLETDKDPQNVLKFTHPAREASFPDLYQLIGHHPLRPPEFTSDHFLQCPRESFRDYIVTIRKDKDFMKAWQETGENAPKPTADVDLNIDNGMPPSPRPSISNLTST
jgi:hypothetical protein